MSEDYPTTCAECDLDRKDCVCFRDDDYELPTDDDFDFEHDPEDDDDDESEAESEDEE